MIWVLVVTAWVMVGIMTAVEQSPMLWNVPVKMVEVKFKKSVYEGKFNKRK